jgi:chromate transport protein ChrA
MAQAAGILAICLFTFAAIVAVIGLISIFKQFKKLDDWEQN